MPGSSTRTATAGAARGHRGRDPSLSRRPCRRRRQVRVQLLSRDRRLMVGGRGGGGRRTAAYPGSPRSCLDDATASSRPLDDRAGQRGAPGSHRGVRLHRAAGAVPAERLAALGRLRRAPVLHASPASSMARRARTSSRLVERRFATPIATGKLHRGRMFHVHYKPLWAAIGEPDSRFRKPTAPGRMIERVMLLDAVLDERDFWLGPSMDKRRHFMRHLGDRLETRDYPHLLFGDGPGRRLRYFPDKLPIGMQPDADPHVFVYLVTHPSPMDFRLFLLRHRPCSGCCSDGRSDCCFHATREGETGLSARRAGAPGDAAGTVERRGRWSGSSPSGNGSPSRAPRPARRALSEHVQRLSALRDIGHSTGSGWTIPANTLWLAGSRIARRHHRPRPRAGRVRRAVPAIPPSLPLG